MITIKQAPVQESKKPAFAERFDKRKAYKHKGGNTLSAKQAPVQESKKPAFAERVDKKKAYKHKGGNVIMVK